MRKKENEPRASRLVAGFCVTSLPFTTHAMLRCCIFTRNLRRHACTFEGGQVGLMRPDDVDDGEIPKEAGQSGLKSDESGDVLPGVWRE